MTERRHASLGMQASLSSGHGVFANRARVLRSVRLFVLLVLLALAAGAALILGSRALRARDLDAAARGQARVYVSVLHPKPGGGADLLELPGTLRGYTESPIYARASGYVLHWSADIGQRVRKGGLLAELATPETDQQLSQARAASEQAMAGFELARSSAQRWEGLRAQDAVSQQDLDEHRSALDQARANLGAAQANVRRLEELESFKRVVAPYDGVVIRRTIDFGDLIDAGAAASGPPMFVVARTDRLRVYVYVPQTYANRIRPGMKAEVRQLELAGQCFAGSVARSAGAIDPTTRTMQVEVDLANPAGQLLPGAYVQVSLPGLAEASLRVPVNALLFRAEGLRVAAVDAAGRVSLRAVRIGRDLGDTVELLEGATERDTLILNPPDSLSDGDVVTVVPEHGAAGT
jgi:RND family efflux transporter MFP subunit